MGSRISKVKFKFFGKVGHPSEQTLARGELGDLCHPLPLFVERGLNNPTLTIPDWLVSLGFEICLFESKSHHHEFFQFIGDIW